MQLLKGLVNIPVFAQGSQKSLLWLYCQFSQCSKTLPLKPYNNEHCCSDIAPQNSVRIKILSKYI